MKYFSLSLLAFIFVLSVSTFSFAALTDTGEESLTLGQANGNSVDVPLSPGVMAGYDVGDWKGTNDWYAVGAYHTAGSKVYATASSISSMWSHTVAAGEVLSDTFATTPNTYVTAGSDDIWSAAGWDQ